MGVSEMEEKLRLKKLHVTYRMVTLSERLAAALTVMTVLMVMSSIVEDGEPSLLRLQLGWICLTVEASVLVYVDRLHLMSLYGFGARGQVAHCNELRLYVDEVSQALEVLVMIVMILTAIIAKSDGSSFNLSLGSEMVASTRNLPLSSLIGKLMMTVSLLVTLGCFLWNCFAHMVDQYNYKKADLKDQQGERLDFGQYVKLAAGYAEK